MKIKFKFFGEGGVRIKNIKLFPALFVRSKERDDQRSVVGVSCRRKCIGSNAARRGLTRSSLSRSTTLSPLRV